ncbi:proline--tRNA ligase [Microaerobacter geothermalis]|uniref:proline--tRNA ligase n=1 Tax=Microaerobacter geothermalis TaxID=674972 RepID=UPI001F19936D|nr:proline--tRNA ligase [Microaerobacter geothermalis]MCF6093798.1 proline--tRNA ligase [Microaerobacter geothermalis]
MRQQHYFLPTLRENPAESETISHQLMIRAGLARQLASGIYSYLPLGLRVLQNIQRIVREEMNRAGAQELVMPAIQPAELWQETGRWDAYGPELMRLKDRHDRNFVLGPTHEEVITSIARDEVRSYKKLPFNLYQIQTKYRDERRPRFGVIRAREFIMKDAYSFDKDSEGLDKSYQAMYDAYVRIFTRCGLHFRAVEADAGAIGGKGTHEFMVLSEIGEDTIAYCSSCSYAANLEKAEVVKQEVQPLEERKLSIEKVSTPNVTTIEELSEFLSVPREKVIKSLLYVADGQPVLALIRGDHELNEIKLKNVFDANVLEMATPEQVKEWINSSIGYIGPIGVTGVKIVADYAVESLVNGITGANEEGYHYVNVNPGIDFSVHLYTDLRNIQEGDVCPHCSDIIQFAKGIEVGHVFKLGTKYSEKLGAVFLDENGKEQPMVMGCYGIGISRTIAAIIEQNHDENGIIWPVSVAPFHVHIIPVNMKQKNQVLVAEEIYQKLKNTGLEVLLDDRQERAGVKFNDADLIGIPIRITVGSKVDEGLIELKVRKTGESREIKVDELVEQIQSLLETI